MLKTFRRKIRHVDVLVLIVGHKDPEYLDDTAESFASCNSGSIASYELAFAIDHNPDCASVLAARHGDHRVYCSPEINGWGRGILRTVAYALDHLARNGLQWEHLITIDSDTLIVGPCLDHYVMRIGPDTCFVGQKWGGGPSDASNPGPTDKSLRQVRYLAKLGLFDDPWSLVDYMIAGPFFLWTRKCLDFMSRIGLLPGSALDEIYPYILFPHDHITTFILGVEGHGFAEVESVSMLYCGGVGGEVAWKTGLPSAFMPSYGHRLPVFPPGTGVIHPIRSPDLEEGAVRAFFRSRRKDDPCIPESSWN